MAIRDAFVIPAPTTPFAARCGTTRGAFPILQGGGITTTYCYRNADGSLGTTTDISEIPVGAERERTISV